VSAKLDKIYSVTLHSKIKMDNYGSDFVNAIGKIQKLQHRIAILRPFNFADGVCKII